MSKSSRATGNKYELEVKKWYEEQGYHVHRAMASFMRTPKWIFTQSHDVFGLFDLICKKHLVPTAWVQVTTAAGKSVRAKKMLEEEFYNKSDEVFLWVRYPMGIWKIFVRDWPKKEFVLTAKMERGQMLFVSEGQVPGAQERLDLNEEEKDNA